MVPYTVAQVDKCAFTYWYPALADASLKSIAIALPEVVVAMLLADKIQFREVDYPPSFVADVKAAIASLGGKVFVKLDWSCPKDAKWILGNSLACVCLEDMVLALKASDFILHDLTAAYDECVDVSDDRRRPETFHLVLKKWANCYDSMHFRCFVKDRRLVGITQRNCGDYYAFLTDETTQDELCNAIGAFYSRYLLHAEVVDASFVFDVYVDKSHRVFLLDINVFGAVTDPLLFTWDELATWRHDEDAIDFRVVDSETAIVPDAYSQYKVPVDLVDHLATPGGFDDFMRQVAKDNAKDADDDDEDDEDEEDDEDDGVEWSS
ncbi:hypothetical protein SDRG_10136 [Saprolegnia diclina VS20]|uniref:Cell division cycle protein 123 n=1 Tax=Saprolegnia diclina (strain VS20) TaxID=1156394 RepID=T0QCG9_SAPDV|nr:hypothetical protein SDRG_10136 [Saprolegnia diclina VS20]EQC32391.1 hypothetical protein SDRG_10136 [Saprolegnia diclina VS20]|eukprot:XP_008614332.1 hypothetical protein SDRG_10136 [Saprolegnia diclina VS20]